jgi:hypothetical protein
VAPKHRHGKYAARPGLAAVHGLPFTQELDDLRTRSVVDISPTKDEYSAFSAALDRRHDQADDRRTVSDMQVSG